MTALAAGLTALVAVVQLGQLAVTAHSWIDCFDTNHTKIYDESASYIYGGSGGNGFCEGYGAGYPGRGDTDIGTGYTFKMLENEVEAGTAVCETVDADTYTSTDWRKRISAAPGVNVYFAYLPNGHIVKDKKAIGTQHGVYWTGEVGTSLTSTLEMTADNLMDVYTLDFDDGNCGESVDSDGNPGGRAGDGKPCIGTFVVPTGTAPGIYSMVWYWTFWLDNEASYVDQAQARGYFGAAYSTCFEVEVTTPSGSSTTATATESPSTNAPEATTSAPQSTTAAPEVTTATPTTEAPATEAPASTTETPVATPDTLTATTSAPDSSSVTSWDQVDSNTAAGDADLSSVTSAPISTTSSPQATTAAPVATSAPVVTTTTPTEAPSETPVPTTAVPAAIMMTEAPIATTSLPVVETTAPVTEAPEATTSAPVVPTEAPATQAPAQTTATPTATTATPTERPEMPETDTMSSDQSGDGYSSLDSATFSSLDDDEDSVGTVRPAKTSSSASSTRSSSSSDSTSSSGSSAVEVGSESYDIEPEVPDDSASASESSEASPTTAPVDSTASSSTASASANAETSFSMKTPPFPSWLAVAFALAAAAVSFLHLRPRPSVCRAVCRQFIAGGRPPSHSVRPHQVARRPRLLTPTPPGTTKAKKQVTKKGGASLRSMTSSENWDICALNLCAGTAIAALTAYRSDP